MIDDALCLRVLDANKPVCGSAQPVTGWVEDTCIDDAASFERVVKRLLDAKALEHDGTVLAATCAERSIWRDGDGVDTGHVFNVVLFETDLFHIPDI